jgi:hypothetical protein
MNYQESLARLEEKKKELKDKVEDNLSSDSQTQLEKRKLALLEKLIKGYSQISASGSISGDKVEQIFGKVYGFTKQKEEIKNLLLTKKYLEVKGIGDKERGKVLCFVGPPGVGKTFFASKFAEALGRKFYPINVGGASSTIIITGGEEMWVGAKSGGIVDAIVKTESCDPVILLDEVEKSSKEGHHGSIENALLHVLDPEQNQHFMDHFLDVEIDISRIIFILTANEITKIPDPLKNRLEIVKLRAYEESEKLEIGKITIDKVFSEDYENNNRNLFEMTEEALRVLISKTKDESGVRQLEGKIKKIISWCAAQWARQLEKGEEEEKIIIDEDKVNEIISEDPEKKAENEETKLREKNKELEEEIKDLKKSRQIFSLTKPVEISQEKEPCEKHQKKTLQTSDKTCFLCELEEQVKAFMALISQESRKKIEPVWEERKLELMKQATDLQSGSPEEQEISRQIKSNIKKIDKKMQQVLKKIVSSTNQPSKLGTKDWIGIIGGGVIILSLGLLLGWVFTKKSKKKKKKQKSDKELATENQPVQPLQLPKGKKDK